MPRIKLTQPAVERLKPPASGRVEYWDSQLPGFGLRVSDSGRKTWIALYRVGGKLVRETIGTAFTIPNVGDARQKARKSLEKAQAGISPVAERRERGRLAAAGAESRASADTFGAVADLFLERYCKQNMRPSTAKETARILDHDARPRWSSKPIGEIGRREINDLMDAIVDRGAPMQANRAFAALRKLFNWAKGRGIVEANPLAGMAMPAAERDRDRVLSDDEIRVFWRACDDLGAPFAGMFKVMLLTAQRRDECAGMSWGELDIDNRTWTIPRDRAKSDRAHEVHLSELAVEVIKGQPRFDGKPFIFVGRSSNAASGFSKAKARLDALMLSWRRSETGDGEASIPEWRLHDLRRSATTCMAKLGVAPHVVDRILNHTSGAISGVAAVYNRYSFEKERAAAHDLWGRYVESLVRPGPGNVVQLERAVS